MVRRILRFNKVRFCLVGITCLGLQYLLLQLFRLWVPPEVANAIGFVLSAQLNFGLSYIFTWRDSERKTGRQLGSTWLQFNSLVVFSVCINTAAFALFLAYWPEFGLGAVAFACFVSTCCSYLVNDKFIFRHRDRKGHVMEIDRVTETVPGIALFMPAWNEAENLPFVVGEAVSYLHGRGEPFQVIIIDDGSTDNTFEVGAALEMAYPENVRLVQHKVNRGYGDALRTGFQAGLDTGFGWIGFCDADGQFKPHEIGKLLDQATLHEADLAIGYRIERADSLKRRAMGKGWHLASRYCLGFKATDVDCGFKVFRRSALEVLAPRLTGQHATISPEILARACAFGHKVVEVGVNHYPRQHGTQSGANLRVVVQSIRGLVGVRRTIKREERVAV